MGLGLWTAVSPFLGRCGEADSPMSPGDSDGTDCAVGEQKPQRVSEAEPRHPPAAAWAGRRPQGPAEDEGKGGREARMGSFGAGRAGAGRPLAPPGPQPGSRCEPLCVVGLRFRVGRAAGSAAGRARFTVAAARPRSPDLGRRWPLGRSRGHMAEGDAGSDQRQVRPRRGADL